MKITPILMIDYHDFDVNKTIYTTDIIMDIQLSYIVIHKDENNTFTLIKNRFGINGIKFKTFSELVLANNNIFIPEHYLKIIEELI